MRTHADRKLLYGGCASQKPSNSFDSRVRPDRRFPVGWVRCVCRSRFSCVGVGEYALSESP